MSTDGKENMHWNNINIRVRKVVYAYFAERWMPLNVAIITGLFMLAAIAIHWYSVKPLQMGLIYLFLASLAGIFVASVVCLIRKQWVHGIVNFLLIPLLFICAFFALAFVSAMTPSDDGFANNLTIPHGITISEPGKQNSAFHMPAKPTILLFNDFQPGMYKSKIWANPDEPGMVYLKAYEVTHETPLSVDDLRNDSYKRIG